MTVKVFKKLPIGYDDFGSIIDKKLYYVDKTDFIKDILDNDETQAVVILRPRRFGKTLNLSLLHYFLADKVLGRTTQGLFDHLKIAGYGQEYMQHQGQYPVVSITFKDIKKSTYESAYASLSALMSAVYFEHRHLLVSLKLNTQQKETFASILNEKVSQTTIERSLLDLMHYLYLHHGVKPWLLIDEYDTPIQAGYIHDYYALIIELMRGMFGSVLKNNPYLNRAVITGILRIPKESLFSGVNNLKVYSLLKNEYSEHFGFTESEMDEILKRTQLLDKAAEIKRWYNGYRIGETVIYNPWSIANCIQEKGQLQPYWINASDNQLIKDLLLESPLTFKTQFESLICGESMEQFIDETMVFADLKTNSPAAWSLLLMAGYLTPVSSRDTYQGTFLKLRVPNREVLNLYRQIIEQWLSNGYGIIWYNQFIDALLTGKIEVFEQDLEKIISQITSYHDFAKEPEAFYQGLMLGLTVSLHGSGTHEIKSNRESGLGRFDIMIIPKDKAGLGIVIELKSQQAEDTSSLEVLADKALKQIHDKQYDAEFKQRGIAHVIKIGIGFKNKTFVLRHASSLA